MELGLDPNIFVFQIHIADELDPAFCSGKIVECSWDAEGNVWVCMRLRPDKLTPNEFMTYTKVFTISCTIVILLHY